MTKELITPKKAEAYLKSNDIANKPLNMEIVNSIANKIKNGEWDPDGDAIYFTRNGRVLSNGQHRMSAIVKAGVPVLVTVVRT